MADAEIRSYKCCIVPMCKNTSFATPNKIFVHVPNNEKRRRAWLSATRRDASAKRISLTSSLYCCEDHFDLQEDMENYMRYRLTNGHIKLKSKIDTVPHIFECQPKRKKISYSSSRSLFSKRDHERIITQALTEPHFSVTDTTESIASTTDLHVHGNDDLTEGIVNPKKHGKIKIEHDSISDSIALNKMLLVSPSFEEPIRQVPVEDSPELKLEKVKLEDETDFRDITDQNFVFVDPLNLDSICKIECCSDDSLPGEVDPLSMKRKPSETSHGACLKTECLSNVGAEQKQWRAQKERPVIRLGLENEPCYLGSAAGGSGSLQSHATSKGSNYMPYACALCSYRSKQKCSIVRHVTKHTGVKPFCCKECKFTTAHSGNLKKHYVLKHAGVKMFSCNECNYKTGNGHYLKVHMSKHFGFKKLCCTECNYKTAHAADLKAHTSIHTGFKTECNYKTASDGTSLKKHMSKHFTVKKFCCTVCNYKTGCDKDLMRHTCTIAGNVDHQVLFTYSRPRLIIPSSSLPLPQS